MLVAILNWGIGHATRMAPVIRALQHRGAQVTLASDGVALQVLQSMFPSLPTLTLPGYKVRYHATQPAWLATLQQSRGIHQAIAAEHKAILAWARSHPTDLILSDNRYGCYASDIPSVFITHQCQPAAPGAGRWLTKHWARQQIRSFDQLAVVDHPDLQLAGRLSMPTGVKKQVVYLGGLSSLSSSPSASSAKCDYLVLLSGPEPQRSVLEESILGQMAHLSGKVVVVGGNPEGPLQDHPHYHAYLSPAELGAYWQQAQYVIGRAGYSTLMDIAVSGKAACVIPTPGQPEQEYLAQLWAEKGWVLSQQQRYLSLDDIAQQLGSFQPTFPAHVEGYFNHYPSAVDQWLSI